MNEDDGLPQVLEKRTLPVPATTTSVLIASAASTPNIAPSSHSQSILSSFPSTSLPGLPASGSSKTPISRPQTPLSLSTPSILPKVHLEDPALRQLLATKVSGNENGICKMSSSFLLLSYLYAQFFYLQEAEIAFARSEKARAQKELSVMRSAMQKERQGEQERWEMQMKEAKAEIESLKSQLTFKDQV